MNSLLQLLFWISVLGLAHSYLFYPWLLQWLGRGRKPDRPVYEGEDADWPFVSIIMSVYNEEAVIRDKLDSLAALEYPEERLQILIGSDCSDDGTNEIVEQFAAIHSRMRFFSFPQRRGKPPVINELIAIAGRSQPLDAHHVLLITDASVLLTPGVARRLAKHFRDERIVVVDARMVHTGMRGPGISRSENQYISREGMIKYLEGLVWGKMVGPFGGCYALRADRFSEVPANFLVDDFYLTMRALEEGGDAISEPKAVCYEPVSHNLSEEYRRKARISAGNFQNLVRFRHLWWPPLRPLAFAFFSHKVLRWIGPFFLLAIPLCSAALAWNGNLFFRFLFLILTGGAILVIALDLLLRWLGLHFLPLRSLRYFLAMNLALLQGFVKFLKGIRSNVWEPTKRNQ